MQVKPSWRLIVSGNRKDVIDSIWLGKTKWLDDCILNGVEEDNKFSTKIEINNISELQDLLSRFETIEWSLEVIINNSSCLGHLE